MSAAPRPLRLAAQTSEDVPVLAAALQDAVARGAEMRAVKSARVFEAPLNRYCWERDPAPGEPGERVRAVLRINDVLAVRAKGLARGPDEAPAVMLTLAFEPAAEPPGGTVRLVFAGEAEIALEVDCLDMVLMDVSQPWRARARPDHDPAQ